MNKIVLLEEETYNSPAPERDDDQKFLPPDFEYPAVSMVPVDPKDAEVGLMMSSGDEANTAVENTTMSKLLMPDTNEDPEV